MNDTSDPSQIHVIPPVPSMPTPTSPENLPLNDKLAESESEKWKSSQEWQDFEILRKECAAAEVHDPGLFEEKRAEYEKQKLAIAQKIKEEIRANFGDPAAAEIAVKDQIFNELVVSEHREYLSALREARSATVGGKILEQAKNILGNRVVKWYLGLSRNQRLAVNFGVGGLVGLGLGLAAPGALGAAAYLGSKGLRAFTSATFGGMAGEWANKKWTIDSLEQAKKEATENIKNSGLSLEDQAKKFDEIEDNYKKEARKIALKKAAVVAGASAGAGVLTGLLENGIVVAESTPLAKRIEIDMRHNDLQNLGPRQGFNPTATAQVTGNFDQRIKAGTYVDENRELHVFPRQENSDVLVKSIKADTHFDENHTLHVVPKVEDSVAEKVVTETERFKIPSHEIKTGDSVWKILTNSLDQNENFIKLTEAQKTYVLSNLVNKVLSDPTKYGLRSDGSLFVGDKFDLNNILGDQKGLGAVLQEAGDKIRIGSPQEGSILENNTKISSWVESNPDKPLNEEVIKEILNPKETVVVDKNDVAANLINKPLANKDVVSGLKNNISELPVEPKVKSSVRSMGADVLVGQALDQEIDGIYGKSGFLGVGKVAGAKTPEWSFMKNQPAEKVFDYFKNPEGSGLPAKVVAELNTSEQHRNLIEHVNNLIQESSKAGAEFTPYNNETMEDFIKRIGKFLLTHQS